MILTAAILVMGLVIVPTAIAVMLMAITEAPEERRADQGGECHK